MWWCRFSQQQDEMVTLNENIVNSNASTKDENQPQLVYIVIGILIIFVAYEVLRYYINYVTKKLSATILNAQ